MNIWKRILAGGALCAVALGLASPALAETIRLGLMCPLTGKWASEGQDMKNIVSLLVDETNAAGGINGKKVELVVEDDAALSEVVCTFLGDEGYACVPAFSGTEAVLLAEHAGKKSEMILCVPNNGAIPGLLDTDVVEVTCTLEDGVITPHHIDHPGELQMELVRRVKIYERLASEALRTKSIATAIDCLMVHPLVNSYSLAKQLVEEYLESNREFTKGWH